MKQVVGLQKGEVRLDKHNPEWEILFRKEKKILLENFPNLILEVSHGGSTAIPGIVAKPIIDIFIAIKSLEDAETIKNELEKLGYEYRGSRSVPERILYVKGNPELRTHHLHFVEVNSDEWKNHILIRDYFLKHPDEANKYGKLKEKLAQKYPNNRESYTHAKDEFIKSIIEKAKKELE